MKKLALILFFGVAMLAQLQATAQCSVCTKTAAQMGEKPAKALNGAIIYLMLMPFAIGGYIGYRWWKNNNSET